VETTHPRSTYRDLILVSGHPVVVPELPALPLPADDFARRPGDRLARPGGSRRDVAQALEGPLSVVGNDVLGDKVAQVSLPENHEVVEALLLDALHPADDSVHSTAPRKRGLRRRRLDYRDAEMVEALQSLTFSRPTIR
jgi:hypothetical protein